MTQKSSYTFTVKATDSLDNSLSQTITIGVLEAEGINDISKYINFSNAYAFAALKDDGSVVTWGDTDAGGAIPTDVDVTNVKTIYSNARAFAAVKEDESVVTWGDSDYGGSVPSSVSSSLDSNVKAIYSTQQAFAAIKYGGSVITLGQFEIWW